VAGRRKGGRGGGGAWQQHKAGGGWNGGEPAKSWPEGEVGRQRAIHPNRHGTSHSALQLHTSCPDTRCRSTLQPTLHLVPLFTHACRAGRRSLTPQNRQYWLPATSAQSGSAAKARERRRIKARDSISMGQSCEKGTQWIAHRSQMRTNYIGSMPPGTVWAVHTGKQRCSPHLPGSRHIQPAPVAKWGWGCR